MAIEKFTISRDDNVYEAFPDLCLTSSGRVLLIYRESNGHVASTFCRLILRFSDDFGHTWSSRQVIDDQDRSSGVLSTWNCPQIQQLKDGRIAITCDNYNYPPGEWGGSAHNAIWYSSDDGNSWTEPQHTTVPGICPDKITELPNGDWLLSTNFYHEKTGQVLQQVTRSTDSGDSWGMSQVVCSDPSYQLGEASVLVCPDGKLVMYLREESGTRRLQKMISTDNGNSWDGPYSTLNPAAQGMPMAGLTQDGLVLITGRFALPSRWRVDDSPETMRQRIERRAVVLPRVPDNKDFIARGKWEEDEGSEVLPDEVIVAVGRTSVHTFAFLEPLESALETDVAAQKGLLLPLDLDNSNIGADGAYTGWVEYDPGHFLVAGYINDDAPLAQIRGYRFSLEDF